MVTTETTLNGILSAWGMDSEPDHPAIPPQTAGTAVPVEPSTSDAGRNEQTGEGAVPSPTEPEPKAEGFGASIGRRLLGNMCDKSAGAGGADRIVELCRAYPIRPYLVEGGGRGFTIPNGWGANETNWAVVKEFERLWWSEAGDEVVERFADKLPSVERSLWEKGAVAEVEPPLSRAGGQP